MKEIFSIGERTFDLVELRGEHAETHHNGEVETTDLL